jgi:hypothetical protein
MTNGRTAVRRRPVRRRRPPAARPVAGRTVAPPRPTLHTRRRPESLPSWLRLQGINVARHAAALRPFRRAEFGTDPAAPTDGHIQAANCSS